jgi:hypothetical protein
MTLVLDTGDDLALPANRTVADEHRRFCVPGTDGVTGGNVTRGFRTVTARDGRGQAKRLPVSTRHATEAGIAALARNTARTTGTGVGLTETRAKLDAHSLRK